jgi:two-component system cell cycle response regulator CtrA
MIFQTKGPVAQMQHCADRSQSVVATGRLAVNLAAKTVKVAGNPVHVTGMEYQVLEFLSLRMGTTLTRENFMNYLYGGAEGKEPEPKIVSVVICKLRKKLSAAGGDKCIETVRGRGYVLRDRTNGATA